MESETKVPHDPFAAIFNRPSAEEAECAAAHFYRGVKSLKRDSEKEFARQILRGAPAAAEEALRSIHDAEDTLHKLEQDSRLQAILKKNEIEALLEQAGLR